MNTGTSVRLLSVICVETPIVRTVCVRGYRNTRDGRKAVYVPKEPALMDGYAIGRRTNEPKDGKNMRTMERKEADRMFGRLKGLFGGKRPIASYNVPNPYERCRRNIMRIHRMVIEKSGVERERGLENAVISSAAIDGLCDRIEYCSDCFERAAVAIDYIANFHPFVEGNKRTSFEVAVRFLRIGGYRLDDDEKTYLFIRDVAKGMYDRGEIEDWLRRNSHLSSP